MKLLSVFFTLFLCSISSFFAQDQLYKKDNSRHDVKVLEVTTTEIKYKLKSNPDGPLYVINKSEVALIIYANGSHETYADAKSQQQQTVIIQTSPFARFDSVRVQRKREAEKDFQEVIRHKNVIFLNTLGLINSSVSLSYLREFGKGIFSIHVPVSFSYETPTVSNSFYQSFSGYYYNVNDFKITSKSIDAGIGIYFNTSGKRAVTHFIGPLFRMAQYNGTFKSYDYYYDQNGYVSYYNDYKTHGFVLNETYFMINNGILFRIIPNFNLMMNIAIGTTTSKRFVANDPAKFVPNQNEYNYYSNYVNNPIFHFGFSAGYRF